MSVQLTYPMVFSRIVFVHVIPSLKRQEALGAPLALQPGPLIQHAALFSATALFCRCVNVASI